MSQNMMTTKAMQASDLMVPIAMIAVVGMMVVPLPAFILDLLLTFNITLSLTTLLVTMYIRQPLEISAFPSLLLMATLFRLALNVSSTRLILLQGYAGRVIQSFGHFVVGGNAVVGFIVFFILVIIQFVVITKGAERVAEVTARFTLDAMPGKQMSIDADLNAGLVDEDQARARRLEVRREADFYGAMDGASKFVKGDAIAGIIISVVNILGGFILGVMQGDLGPLEVLQKYTILTIGDGLVSQIPALLISTATGILVTRAVSEGSLGQELTSQVFNEPKVLYMAAGFLAILGIIPGLPHLSFLGLSLLFAYLANRLGKAKGPDPQDISAADTRKDEPRGPEAVAALLPVDPLEINLGYGLISLADADQGGDLLDKVVFMRRQLALELGLLVPTVRIRDDVSLLPNSYVVLLRGVQVGTGEILPTHYLAMGDLGQKPEPGIPTREPAFDLPAWWITEDHKLEVEQNGFTVVDPATVVATHLTEIIKRNADSILSRQQLELMLETVREESPALVNETVPGIIAPLDLKKILGNLLEEGVAVRDLTTILETIGDYGRLTKDTDTLTEYVRQALGRQISHNLAVQNQPVLALTLDRSVEDAVETSLQRTEQGTFLAMDPQTVEKILASVRAMLDKMLPGQESPIILASPMIRFYFKRLVKRSFPHLTVISYNELDPKMAVDVLGRVSLE